jgi:adenylate cyclase class IV
VATNLELKCRTKSLESAHTAARSLGIQPTEILLQTDVYFAVPGGRLKLRRIAGKPAELIQYDREDAPGARWSRYSRFEVSEPDVLQEMLANALGIRGIVQKTRTLYLYGTARIHLDNVEGLGAFLEFEIVETAPGDALAVMDKLRTVFSIRSDGIVGGSYIDMVEQHRVPDEESDICATECMSKTEPPT